ncbi:MAG TPA: NUDIX domain-containing protein [Flavitalea sp.]|nr:NUDIX domain-containing protein [Flavitalea sp.]
MPVRVYKEDKIQQVEDLKAYSKNFEVIKAAGGAVTDDEGRILLIFRRGKWDLPKGKLEQNEPIELCAEREVKEETGLKHLELRKPLMVTYHTYSEKGTSILKETHWFLFDAPGQQKLQPQKEEDISKAEWVEKENTGEYKKNTYQLIKEVLAAAGY